MNKYRVFYTLHKLSKSEEEKLLKWSRQGGDKPDIKYRKTKKVEVVEADSIVSATHAILRQELIDFNLANSNSMSTYLRKFATVYAVVEYREGEKLGSLEEFFTAKEVDLIPKEEA